MRIGTGYDLHRLVDGRRLVLGGVTLPFEKGLDGHSDADVLVHAVCDALLGAAGLGDIGDHFPDTDDRFRNVSSLLLLTETGRMLKEKGFFVVNIDATVLAQAPKLGDHKTAMAAGMAKALGMDTACVNVKATTTEGLDAVGRGEAMAAMSVALIDEG